jgi:hypothetical protein
MGEMGSGIVKRVDSLLSERRETRKALVSAGFIKSTQSVTDWGKRGAVPRADVALAIADYFGVSVRWLITGKDEEGLIQSQRNLLGKFDCLTDENQRNVLALIDSMLSVVPASKEKKQA